MVFSDTIPLLLNRWAVKGSFLIIFSRQVGQRRQGLHRPSPALGVYWLPLKYPRELRNRVDQIFSCAFGNVSTIKNIEEK